MSDFLIEQINDQPRLSRLVERLSKVVVMAVDLETVEWWNRERERVALIQIAYRSSGEMKVAVIDPLALENLEALRQSLEEQSTLKVIHNAAFDAVRLLAHYKFKVAPIHDTMVAARLNKEKKYSLQAQAATHLNLHLDKGAQRSDWSHRPLAPQQLHYAALDAWATLRLYEHQKQRSLFGNYRLRGQTSAEHQVRLPLDADPFSEAPPPAHKKTTAQQQREFQQEVRGAKLEDDLSLPITAPVSPLSSEVTGALLALLGIIAELPNRYGPEQLAVSVGAEKRVGLAGWVVDRTLGSEAELDEETAKISIGQLCERKLVAVTLTGRLEATPAGTNLWRRLKTV